VATRIFAVFVIVFGVAQIGMLALLVNSLASGMSDETEAQRRLRQQVARLAKAGMTVGLLSIVPWALDSAFCDTLIEARRIVPEPLSALTHLHAVWHLGSGLCAHLAGVPVMIVWLRRNPAIAVRLRHWRHVVWWLERVEELESVGEDAKVSAGCAS